MPSSSRSTVSSNAFPVLTGRNTASVMADDAPGTAALPPGWMQRRLRLLNGPRIDRRLRNDHVQPARPAVRGLFRHPSHPSLTGYSSLTGHPSHLGHSSLTGQHSTTSHPSHLGLTGPTSRRGHQRVEQPRIVALLRMPLHADREDRAAGDLEPL